MESKYRRKISSNQVELLALLIKFRFVTVELVSRWCNKSKTTIYRSLRVLENQGYIQKRYEKEWRLLGRPAVYSLTGKGARVIRDDETYTISEAVIRNQYKNRSASLQLVDHSLDVAKLCLQLSEQGCEDVFSKSEIDRFEELFIRPLPALYIRTGREDEDGHLVHYQLEVIEAGTFTWMIKKRITAHVEWLEEQDQDGWAFEDNYPHLLFVCDNTSTEKRIHRLVDSQFFDFEIWTTTQERLTSNKRGVWIELYDPDEQEYHSL